MLPRLPIADSCAQVPFLLPPNCPSSKRRSLPTPPCHRTPAPRRRYRPCTPPSHRCGPPSPSSGRAAASGSGATSCCGTCPAPSPPRGPGLTQRKYPAWGKRIWDCPAELSRDHGHQLHPKNPLYLVHVAITAPGITAPTCLVAAGGCRALSQGMPHFHSKPVSQQTSPHAASQVTATGGTSLCLSSRRTARASAGPIFKGVCKQFSRSQGHGFITPENGTEDIFVHVSE